MATSVVMGVVAIPFFSGLSGRRTILIALAYAVASYPVVFSAVISWLHPLMFDRSEFIPMTAGHAVFGLVLGSIYARVCHGGAEL